MKKEFTEEELYKNMKYIIYCIEMEKDINHYLTKREYEEFLKGTDKHYGDCTAENCPCIKCANDSIEKQAIDILSYLSNIQEEQEEEEEPIEPTPPDTEDRYESDVKEEEPIGYWENSDAQRAIRASRILIDKYPEEFKKIVEGIE